MAKLHDCLGEKIVLAREHTAQVEKQVPLGDATDNSGVTEPKLLFGFLGVA
jgi:hypothetical protein